jgi:Na+/H+ antiporter NhaD/arsenite permease-like protein
MARTREQRGGQDRQFAGWRTIVMLALLTVGSLLFGAAPTLAAPAGAGGEPVLIGSVPVDFILFALILLGIALFHHHTFNVAMTGLAVIVGYKLLFTGFKTGPGLGGFVEHLAHEWVTLANLFCLLMGFALLAKHFEDSKLPEIMPRFMPDDWKGGFMLLAIVWVMSSFLDNIAAALIGGTMAKQVFRNKVHIGYIAAIVAASNAGGAFSVVGDTTTTMMWIDGVSPLSVFDCVTASAIALFICGIPAAFQQHAYQPIAKDETAGAQVDWARVFIVFFILVSAILANVFANLKAKWLLDMLPVLGFTVALAILVTSPLRQPDWHLLGENLKGTLFLLALVLCASLMPVEKLPLASWQSAMGLGFLSSVFDNIPLTALALKQGGYDWGFLAFAVGFGGSMTWFGSSAGVAITNLFPEGRSVLRWVTAGWHVILAYVISYLVMLAMLGWKPDAPHKKRVDAPSPPALVHLAAAR